MKCKMPLFFCWSLHLRTEFLVSSKKLIFGEICKKYLRAWCVIYEIGSYFVTFFLIFPITSIVLYQKEQRWLVYKSYRTAEPPKSFKKTINKTAVLWIINLQWKNEINSDKCSKNDKQGSRVLKILPPNFLQNTQNFWQVVAKRWL